MTGPPMIDRESLAEEKGRDGNQQADCDAGDTVFKFFECIHEMLLLSVNKMDLSVCAAPRIHLFMDNRKR